MPKKPLAETHPELAKQWHPSLNGDLTARDVTPGFVRSGIILKIRILHHKVLLQGHLKKCGGNVLLVMTTSGKCQLQ